MTSLVFALVATSLQAQEKPLNVLFISVDDLRPDFGKNRSSWVKTPNIDQLESEGVYFKNAYCQYPVCGPSRSSLMTGLLPDSSGVYGFEDASSKVGQVTILPQLFKDHGYATARFGKVFNNPMDFKEAWDEKPLPHIPDGYTYHYMNYATSKNRELCKDAGSDPDRDVSEGTNQMAKPPAIERVNVPDEEFIDNRYADLGIDFIERNKDRPFFCAVGFRKPHLPFSAPERFWKPYDETEIPFATNPFHPKRTEDWMANNWEELRSYSDIPNDGPMELELERTLIQGYFATVSWVDYQIGRLLETLDRNGLRENTAVIFWSDHSFHLGENGIWAKHVNWELTNHLPLMISTPSMITQGQKSDALVELLDVFPTVAEIAGLPLPNHLDGRSLAPLLENPQKEWAEAALSQYRRDGKMSYSIRTTRYRYGEWRTVDGELKKRELYDLHRDPEGNVNLAEGVEYTNVVEEHSQILQRMIDRAKPVAATET